MRLAHRGLLLLALTAPTWASAELEALTIASAPYQSLVDATVISADAGVDFVGGTDDGYATIPLPFVFPYFGASYAAVHVAVNGLLAFSLPEGCAPERCFPVSPVAIPSPPANPSIPRNFIAPFFADLDANPAKGGLVRYSSGVASFTVEWFRLPAYRSPPGTTPPFDLTMSVTLRPDGVASVHYGPKSVRSEASIPTASSGFADSTGFQGAAFLALPGKECSLESQAGCCSSPASAMMDSAGSVRRCAPDDFVPDTLVMLRGASAAELEARSVTGAGLVEAPGGGLSLTFSAEVRNPGQADAGSFGWNTYLSADRALGAGDLLVASGQVAGLAAGSSLVVTGPVATASAPDAGLYHLLFEANPLLSDGGLWPDGGERRNRAVGEYSYHNNLVSTVAPLSWGVDVEALEVGGPVTAVAGDSVPVRVSLRSAATQSVAQVEYALYLSADGAWDTSDPLLFAGVMTNVGTLPVEASVAVTLPTTLVEGSYRFVVRVDPGRRLAELSTANNTRVASAATVVHRADLVALKLEVLDPLTASPTQTAHLGEPVSVRVAMANVGAGPARAFSAIVVLSVDNALSLLADTVVWEGGVGDLAAGAERTITLPVRLPLTARGGRPLPSGRYFLFLQLNSTGAVGESTLANNLLSVGPLTLYAPGPDLAVGTVQVAPTAGAGEVLAVRRVLRNLGNVDAPASTYRFFISANGLITTDDLALTTVAPDGASSTSAVQSLPAGALQVLSELVRLPEQLSPGTYFVGCIIDPDDAVAEFDESNNANVSQPVVVVGSSLRVLTTQLPDSITGRPYLYRLAASGERGESTWSVDPRGGPLPGGLTLGPDGLLSGTPTGAERRFVQAFTVLLENGGRTAVARLALRVLAPSTQLAITSAVLPPVINSAAVPFEHVLGAAGGLRPYVWRVVGGMLPSGLVLSDGGTLSGSPRVGVADGITKLTFEVRDGTGTEARRELSLRLVSAGSLVFRTAALPDALLGIDYGEDIAVQNLDGSLLARPLTWNVTGVLPPGLALERQSEVLSLGGRPTTAGSFAFNLSVEDARGRSDAMDFTVAVHARRLAITASLPVAVSVGDLVRVAFAAQPASQPRFALAGGLAPPGLTMGADGVLEGTVASEASAGTYAFVVEATDVTGARGLAPFGLAVVGPPPPAAGCSSAGSPLSALGWVAVAVAAGWRSRRRAERGPLRWTGALAVLAALLLPLTSRAQTAYSVEGPRSAPYQPIVGGTAIAPSALEGTRVALPFTFDFYGIGVSSVTLSRFGYLALFSAEAGESANQAIPHRRTDAPTEIIAPWWDDLAGGSAKWMVTGAAPSRVVVFEWIGVSPRSAPTAKFSFQAQLFESTNQLRFTYSAGAPSGSSASIGIMGAPGVGLAAIPCASTGTCGPAYYPANKAFDFFQPPDLALSSVEAEAIGYSGVPLQVSVRVANMGGKVASSVMVRLYVSSDATLDAADSLAGYATLGAVPARGEALVALAAVVPPAMPQGVAFLLARVDPDNQIVELDEANNAFTPQVLTVVGPMADLSVTSVGGPANAAPGTTVEVTRAITNAGNASISDFLYSWFLSENSTVTVADRALPLVGRVSDGLAARATDSATEHIVLPGDLRPGRYWLGVCANYDSGGTVSFLGEEITWVNNCAAMRTPTVISWGALSVTTLSLPPAAQFSAWGLRLAAVGGDGVYLWSVADGVLPAGLSLSPEGELRGAPAVPGSFSFGVAVESAAQRATQVLQLDVGPAQVPLVIVDQELPSAEFARPYRIDLVATGGRPPYQWGLKEGALPAGLALATDGHIEGQAIAEKDASFTVQLTDAAQAAAAKSLTLRVVRPSALAIATRIVKAGQVRHDYLEPLVAVGGLAPYTWTVSSVRQVPVSPLDGSRDVTLEALGLYVAHEEGLLKGVLKQSGLFRLQLAVVDASGAKDAAFVDLWVGYREGFAITTTALPDAFIGVPYAVRLGSSAGAKSLGAVKFSLACVMEVREVGSLECAQSASTQTLPSGLALGESGALEGTVEAAEGVYGFWVRARDEWGQEDVRPLAVRVRAAARPPSGCSSAADGPWIASLVVGVLLALGRQGRATTRGAPR